jgi:hypothetical protein
MGQTEIKCERTRRFHLRNNFTLGIIRLYKNHISIWFPNQPKVLYYKVAHNNIQKHNRFLDLKEVLSQDLGETRGLILESSFTFS